jgi:dolichyl-phosphate-mannose-protein mannosyltransferase
MGRVTYLHHYFPALYFTILMVPFLLDHFTRNSSATVRYAVFVPVFLAVIYTFIRFAPVAFGMEDPVESYRPLRWRETWNLVD